VSSSSNSSGSSGGGFGEKRDNKKQKGFAISNTASQTATVTGTSSTSVNTETSLSLQHDDLLAMLASQSANSVMGKIIAESKLNLPVGETIDPFWDLMPSLISSRFPQANDLQLQRIAGFVKHVLNPNLNLEDSIINDRWRPNKDIHAYMPGLGTTHPFHEPSSLELCRKLSDNVDIIEKEYDALIADMMNQDDENNGNTRNPNNNNRNRFQSVTSMNYDAGWKTLVLFYNGNRIPNFPYHICPVTTSILESVPLAGRIAGFNRQRPKSGIPLHSDGNNMWLTCQMGIKVPSSNKEVNNNEDDPFAGMASIRVGPHRKSWTRGGCLLYDTTYEHETWNDSIGEERVVLHVDFYNTLQMTSLEIQIMQYIYNIREEFLKAEGVAKVGDQIL